MSFPRTFPLLAASLAVALVPLALADPPKPDPDAARIARLIEQMGSESFAEREAATKALEGIGEPALRPLQRAAKACPDLEVRRRAERLVSYIDNLDYLRLQGSWTIIKLLAEDRAMPINDLKMVEVVFVRNEVKFIGPLGTSRNTFHINARHWMKEVDFGERLEESVQAQDTTWRGIYFLDANQLTVCFGRRRASERPTQLATGPDSQTCLCVLRRVTGTAPK